MTTPPALDELRERFEAATGSVRLIAFLSPTCGPCRYGQGVVRALFETLPEAALRGYIVWVPMLDSDSAETAGAEQASIKDPRIESWYDADRSLSRAWADMFGLHGYAWDVYAAYAPSDDWPDIASPRIWMHQLDFEPGVNRSDRLDTARLAAEITRLLDDDSVAPLALASAMHEAGARCASR